jgi:hypothetical protein
LPRDGAIIFRDLVGKLDALNVECDKCGRRGQYRLARLIERYGIDAKLFDWAAEITADCPRKQTRNLIPPSLFSRSSGSRDAWPEPTCPLDADVVRFGLTKPIVRLIEAHSIPFATLPAAKALIDESHELHLGTYRDAASPPDVRVAIESADALGCGSPTPRRDASATALGRLANRSKRH